MTNNKSIPALHRLLRKLEPRRLIERNALLGNGDGSTVLTGNTNEVYVRLSGADSRVVRATNTTNIQTYGIAVDVEVIRHVPGVRGEQAQYNVSGISKQLSQAGVAPPPDVLASVAGVDLNTGTPTLLYTVPPGRSCIVVSVTMRNASTSLTTASVSFGFNSAAYNDVIADATHTELTGATLYTILYAKIGAKRGATGDSLKVKANVAQGAAATVTIDVRGYLF